MPRPKLIDRTCRLEVRIPESIFSKMQLELFSELEGRVPFGRNSEVITELVKNWLVEKRGVEV